MLEFLGWTITRFIYWSIWTNFFNEIPSEVWKTKQFVDILFRHCNAIYNQNPINRWTKGCILPFPKKRDLRLAKNYRGITFTSVAPKIYNALQCNRIEPKLDNILRKNQNDFRRNRSTTSQILTIRRILEGVRAKNPRGNNIICRLYQGLWLRSQRKDGANSTRQRPTKRNHCSHNDAILKHKSKSPFPDKDTDYFDIVAGVLQWDTLAPYLFNICLDCVLRTSIDKILKKNDFKQKKERSRKFPAKTVTDVNYADDIALLSDAPAQAETLLHSLKRAAASIGLYVNAHKTEYMCFNQTGEISTLNGSSLKLVDKFTYLGSSIGHMEVRPDR